MARFNFTAAVTEGLRRLGAREGGRYGWQLDTVAGILNIAPYDNWVACRFDDVERANQTIGFGTLNRYSGKWNWHFDKPTLADAEFVLAQLERAHGHVIALSDLGSIEQTAQSGPSQDGRRP